MVNNNVHRVPVVDADGALVSIVTQSHMIRLIFRNSSRFPITQKKISDLKIGNKGVVTVRVDQKAIEAFNVIEEKKVTGLGVVDAHGKLIGNISATDMRNIGQNAELISRVFHPVDEFLQYGNKGSSPLVCHTCSPHDTLAQVLDTLVTTRSHRIYVQDQDASPLGVISLGDILAAVQKSI